MAYNDQIAISVPCKTEFKGAVPGNVLLSILKNSKAKDVEFTPVDAEDDEGHKIKAVEVKAASSKIKLGLLPEKAFTEVFEIPDGGDGEPIGEILSLKAQPFLDAIESCMRSVGTDTGIADTLGITVIPGDDELRLYSTNDVTMSRAIVKVPQLEFDQRIILPASFCLQLQKLAQGSKKIELELAEDFALFVTEKGLKLFCRLIESEKPVQFDEILAHHFKESDRKKMVPVPSKLKLIIERATIITDSATDQSGTDIVVKAGKVKFKSKSPKGEIIDTLQVGDGQPDTSLRIEAKRLKSAFGFFTHMLMSNTGIVMAKDDTLYLAAALGE